eukprot:5108480-Karenia_brevis.AAC.1
MAIAEGVGRQSAATCGLHALQHLLAGMDGDVVLTRPEFEAQCRPDEVEADGNYEFAAMHRILGVYRCGMEPVVPDVVETITVQEADGSWGALFRPGFLQTLQVLGYLVHVSGHWISLVPTAIGSAGCVCLLCDSLYDHVFEIHGEELAEWLEAMACQQMNH